MLLLFAVPVRPKIGRSKQDAAKGHKTLLGGFREVIGAKPALGICAKGRVSGRQVGRVGWQRIRRGPECRLAVAFGGEQNQGDHGAENHPVATGAVASGAVLGTVGTQDVLANGAGDKHGDGDECFHGWHRWFSAL